MRVWFTTLSLLLKRFAGACVLAVGAILVTSVAAADAYPAKPVRLITPYAPGGNADIQARYIAERLSETLGRQFVVDNRGRRERHDRHRALHACPRLTATRWCSSRTRITVMRSLFPKVPYDMMKDLQPITLVGETPELFIANSARPCGQRERGARAREEPSGSAQLRLVRQRLAFTPRRGTASSCRPA